MEREWGEAEVRPGTGNVLGRGQGQHGAVEEVPGRGWHPLPILQ